MKYYLFLAAAIICEAIGTSFLKKTEQFTKPIPTAIFVIAMVSSFFLLSNALKGIPIGISYAIWSGVGIVVISLVGYFIYNENLDLPAIIGIVCIIIGVIIINVFSSSTTHS
ncbi:DMT family transporter [Faecalibacter rhinopitheci]|uniref:Multidrug efflux SMR transporter n=1 Tax=Faecalibacter rhinopitheci TaxID=2779678 RepID=A0A8J7G355_9FLAO|nr:multidrug efflux SMR transporter [Faecalibacter rhinopitheci]MBF0595922.1 multidrug efflux SMR transporter [Faecalibacter rhinopitheci]